MFKFLHNYLIKSLASLLVVAVLLPTIIKVGHLFSHHEHDICEINDNSKTHFHEVDLDCEFYKFKITNTYFFSPNHEESQAQIYKARLEDSYYLYFLPHQQIVSYLRGPPQLA